MISMSDMVNLCHTIGFVVGWVVGKGGASRMIRSRGIFMVGLGDEERVLPTGLNLSVLF